MKKLLLIILLMLSVSLIYAGEDEIIKIAVLDSIIEEPVLKAEVAGILKDFKLELGSVEGITLIERKEIYAALKKTGIEYSGQTAESAIKGIYKHLDIDQVIASAFKKEGEKYFIQVDVYNAKKGKIIYSTLQEGLSAKALNDSINSVVRLVIEHTASKRLAKVAAIKKYREIQASHWENKVSLSVSGKTGEWNASQLVDFNMVEDIGTIHKNFGIGLHWSPANFVKLGFEAERYDYNDGPFLDWWGGRDFHGIIDTYVLSLRVDGPSVMGLVNIASWLLFNKGNAAVGIAPLWRLAPYISFGSGITMAKGGFYQWFSFNPPGFYELADNYIYTFSDIGLNYIISEKTSIDLSYKTSQFHSASILGGASTDDIHSGNAWDRTFHLVINRTF